MVASSQLYILLVISLLPFLMAAFAPALLSFAIFVDVLIFVALIIDIIITPSTKLLSGERQIEKRLSIGRPNLVTLTIFNQSKQILTMKIKDDYPDTCIADKSEFNYLVPGLNKLVIQYNLTPKKRGRFQFGKTHIRYLSTLNLFWRNFSFANEQETMVFNDLKALNELSIKLSHASELGEIQKRKRGAGTEFASLKEYQVGDDHRFIDWKATAKRSGPVVKTYDVQHEQTLTILVDAGRTMAYDLGGLTRLDYALNSALALALTALYRGDQVGLAVFADKPICYLPAKRGRHYLRKMLETVFDILPRAQEPDYQGVLSYYSGLQKGRSLMVVLTDLSDTTASQSLLAGLLSMRNHLPFCVTLKDKQLNHLANKSPVDETDIYRKVTAIDLINARELAFSTLNRGGCLTLDCPPEDLSSRLIAQYLDIKARNLL